MEFQIDKKRRRMIGNRLVRTSLAFRVTVVVCIVMWVAAPISCLAMRGMESPQGMGEAWPFVACLPGIVLAVVGLAVLLGMYLGVGNQVLGRFSERLELNAGFLTYSYHDSNDSFPNGRMAVMARVDQFRWHVDESGEYLVFDGGARFNWYRNALSEQVVPFEEMEPLKDFQVGLYWTPDLPLVLTMNTRESGQGACGQ